MPDTTAPRDHLVRALQADLIGPYQLDEEGIADQDILELPPRATTSPASSPRRRSASRTT